MPDLKPRKIIQTGHSLASTHNFHIVRKYELSKGMPLEISIIEENETDWTVNYAIAEKTLIDKDVFKLKKILAENEGLTIEHKVAIYKLFNPLGTNKRLMQSRLTKAILKWRAEP